MTFRAVCTVTSLALAALALSACVPEPATDPTAAPTATETVPASSPPVETETPATPPADGASADDPLTALGAWSICAGIATEYFPVSDWQRVGYSPDAVHDQGGGTFEVTVPYSQNTGGGTAAIDCIVGGTVGAPDVLVNGPYDLG